MFVIFLLAAAVLLNILDNFSKALSVAYPDSKYGVLGFGCSIKAVVRSFAYWQIWSTEFVVGILIVEGRKCTVSEIHSPPFYVIYILWYL